MRATWCPSRVDLNQVGGLPGLGIKADRSLAHVSASAAVASVVGVAVIAVNDISVCLVVLIGIPSTVNAVAKVLGCRQGLQFGLACFCLGDLQVAVIFNNRG